MYIDYQRNNIDRVPAALLNTFVTNKSANRLNRNMSAIFSISRDFVRPRRQHKAATTRIY